MYALDAAKKQILTNLKKALGKTYTPTVGDLATPPDEKLGDLTFPCFVLAKGLRRNPAELATELAARMAVGGLVKSVTATGPYVNFFLDSGALAAHVFADIKKSRKKYGTSKTGVGKRILLEYANPNTHKEIHIGHIRNFAHGHAMVNLLRATGYDVTPVSYINDLGNNVAKAMWGIIHLYNGEVPKEGDMLLWFGKVYVEAGVAIGDDPEKKAQVSEIQSSLEEMTGPYVDLWKRTQKLSMEGLKEVFAEFDLPIEHTYVEHELIDATHAIVRKLQTDGIATVSQGAVVVDLEDEGLGVNLLRKTDGTLLYNAKDLALAAKKEEDYHPDRSLYVIDSRQSLAIKQLQATLKKMGLGKEVEHLPFDIVTLPDGAMSSRKGNVVRWTEFRDTLRQRVAEETARRHPTWRTKKIRLTSATLAQAAVVYTMVKQDPEKVLTFDAQEAMSVEGNTGPYLMYSFVRIQTLLKKAAVRPYPYPQHLTHPREHTLLRQIATYPQVVHMAAMQYNPAFVAQYAFSLAQEFAGYYEDVRIAGDEDRNRMAARLALLDAVGQTLHNALTLLGVPLLKEM